jgi:hypothetical protein
MNDDIFPAPALSWTQYRTDRERGDKFSKPFELKGLNGADTRGETSSGAN